MTNQRIFNYLITFIVTIIVITQVSLIIRENKPHEIRIEFTVSKKNPDFMTKTPEEGLRGALEYHNVKFPEIVYAQAQLETGNFKSKIYKDSNNLFGLYNSNECRFYSFSHWTESVIFYKDYIQSRYKPPNDYYKFLSDIGYAEDPHYITKVKEIVKQNDTRRSKKLGVIKD